MLRKKKRWVMVMIMLSAGMCAWGQVARMPFEFDGKHIYLRVGFMENDSLRFIFDTGATGISIDSVVAENAGLTKHGRQKVEASGHGGTKSYTMVRDQTLRVAGMKISGLNPTLVNFSEMRRETGMNFDGLIGYELLQKYVTKVDFGPKQLSFYANIDQIDTTGYTGIPFEFNKSVLIPRFPVTIRLNNGESFTGRVMFDSGGFFTLLVSAPFNKFHHLSEKLPNREINHSRGMSAVTTEERSVIQGMSFNGFELGPMPIDLTVNQSAEAKDGYLGMIGSQIIQRFDLIIDYQNKKIYLRPNQNYHQPFKINMEKPSAFSDEGKGFLAANAKRKGVQVTPSGLQYEVLQAGQGPRPLASDKVKIYYRLSLTDGKQIWDEFNRDNPWEHHIDKALSGMQEALLLMPVGSRWKIYMPAELAFGPQGYEDVPPGAVIVAEMELVDILK